MAQKSTDEARRPPDPGRGHLRAVAAGPVVEERDDLAFELVVQRALDIVIRPPVRVVTHRETRPVARSLVPPAVEDGQIEDSVHRGLHARRARGLVWPDWIVQPDVRARDEKTGEAHVVVVEEDDAAPELRERRELPDPPQELLAGLVLRVRFPREEELNRPVRVLQEPRDALRIVKDQDRKSTRLN